MLKLADRVKQTSLTEGTGSITFNGTFGSFQPFSVIGNGNTTYYTIENGSNFEVGIGAYTSASNSLSRDLVLESSNNNQKINLVGLSIVFCTYPADHSVFLNENGYISGQMPFYSGIVFPDNSIQSRAYNENYRNIFSSTNILSTDDIIFVDCSSGNINLTLPSAINLGGKKINIKRKNGNFNLTISTSSSQKIDGANSFSIFNNYQAITFVSDNSNWFII
ncbi:hypothetical protein EB118_14815 [bacterium]|nr:hypothetical protein [bacterium]